MVSISGERFELVAILMSPFRPIYLLPLGVVLVIGMAFFVLRKDEPEEENAGGRIGQLEEGNNYYVFVRSLEIEPKTQSGKDWDALIDKAPDPYYEVYWRDNRIFRSSTQEDQLIATWSPLGVDTLDSIREGRIAVDSVIKAAALRAVAGETFKIRILDNDPVSEDVLAELTFSLNDLRIGDNDFSYEEVKTHSVVRLRLAVVDADVSLVGQLEKIINPS